MLSSGYVKKKEPLNFSGSKEFNASNIYQDSRLLYGFRLQLLKLKNLGAKIFISFSL